MDPELWKWKKQKKLEGGGGIKRVKHAPFNVTFSQKKVPQLEENS